MCEICAITSAKTGYTVVDCDVYVHRLYILNEYNEICDCIRRSSKVKRNCKREREEYK